MTTADRIDTVTLAGEGVPGPFLLVGLIIIAVLLGGFWWGSRLAARKRTPPQEPQPRQDSWETPDDDTDRHSDGGQR